MPPGFTLVELLTVIAILAILATLLGTSLASAKRKARQAGCTANLHQIALAIDMYLDDQRERPAGFQPLVTERYLANSDSFRCPEDRAGDWGTLVEGAFARSLATPALDPGALRGASVDPLKYSYLSPLWWEKSAWDVLQGREAVSGVAACQLHGVRRLNEVSLFAYEGLLLRGQRDGAVVRRHIFWPSAEVAFDAAAGLTGPVAAVPATGTTYPWPLFLDDPLEELNPP